jgi:hypothetical protein
VALQRFTIAKIGGLAATVIEQRLRAWTATRLTDSRTEWSGAQWPKEVRGEVDAFAAKLRASAALLPVIHFVEWIDSWSMGDEVGRWLMPSDGPPPLVVIADQFEMYGYALPDDGCLLQSLADARAQQFIESDWLVTRLREAVEAWQLLVDRALLVVLRRVIDVSMTDDQVKASLLLVPDWLAE